MFQKIIKFIHLKIAIRVSLVLTYTFYGREEFINICLHLPGITIGIAAHILSESCQCLCCIHQSLQ